MSLDALVALARFIEAEWDEGNITTVYDDASTGLQPEWWWDA